MPSSQLPNTATIAAGSAYGPARRRRRFTVHRALRGAGPYLLILPVVLVIGAILGYPIYHLVRLSFEEYGLFDIIRAGQGLSAGKWIGFGNYDSVLHDSVFWHTLLRTIVFTIVNV